MNNNDFGKLKDYGIDVGLLVSGLFGAVLLTSKGSAMNLTRTIGSLIGGAASANYITPIVMHLASLDNSKYQYGIAFLLGFLGLRGVELVSKRLLPEDSTNNDIRQAPARRKKRRVPRRA